MFEIFRSNTKSFLTFVLIFGFASLVPTQVITMERYELVIAFYLVAIGLLLYFFYPTYKSFFQQTRWYELLILVTLSLVIHGLVSYFIINYVERPSWPFSDRGTSFLLMNSFYVWAKPFDILVQQLLIVWLAAKLYKDGLTLKQIISFFLVAFGAIHIFQVLKTDWMIGLLFTAGALASSVVYPYLILRTRNGYIYNYMVHLGLYNIAALTAWLLY
jgi:hypothetical protein